MARRVLVTGASGFVGSVLVRRLLSDGHAVHALVRPGSERWRLDGLDVPLVEVDLADGAAVADTVAAVRPEWIFHLAAHGAYPSQRDLRQMVESNLLGTIYLVEACLENGFETLVNTGSSSEYGFTDHAPSESEPPHPNSDYAVTKLSATLYCRATAQQRGARIPTLRLYSVYGPYEDPTRLVPALAVHGLAGALPPLVSPDVSRDFVFVEDVVDAYVAAASSKTGEPGAIYNVGTGAQVTVAQAVETARNVLSIGAEPRWGTLPNRSWDTSVWISDPRKIERELGWRAKTGFEDGFRRFVDWMKSDVERQEFYRGGLLR
jgi:nucleoside-diphosphate-sugar epimerase